MRLGHTEVMIRRATADDVDAMVELRAAMFATMGDPPAPNATWRILAAEWFREHLGRDSCGYIVRTDEEPVAAALGYVHTAPPSPSNLASVTGRLSNVITLEGHRRGGHARACVEALIDWFRDETPAERVDLAASEDGLALYESLGWIRRDQPTLRLRLNRE